MKYLILFLLSLPAYAAQVDVDSVRVGEGTLLVRGENIYKVNRATFGGKPVGVMHGNDLVVFCRNLTKAPCSEDVFIPGVYTLKLFKNQRLLAKYPVTVTGQETIERPPLPTVIPPTPIGIE